MESPKSNQPMAALDSLRTVEFRQTLRGYHIDDVDEYLEKVAVEAEALQEQVRLAAERMRQAADRIAQLEQPKQPQPPQQALSKAPAAGTTEETLQRTLVLAQKFVDQTHAEAEAQARAIIEQAEKRARAAVSEAEERARSVAADTAERLRTEVARLEAQRAKLAGDVETIARHLETERARLRGALGEMLHWIDEHVQPEATLLAQPPADRSGQEAQDRAESPADRPGLMPLGQGHSAPNGSPR
ncbi:MAG TPA: DivIVA domain-containing protein [Acidimicrobiales bacterium]|nr:DivIVA domain-containing protein [Acidimicrobiales bacterium]